MNTKVFTFCLVLIAALSCSKDGPRTLVAEVTIATPITKTVAELRESVAVEPVRDLTESGKFYAYQNFILVNDLNKGIHVIDNTYPTQPVKVAFINIPGNIDMAVKDNILYADSWLDLYVFDFSDPLNITLINRLEEVLPQRRLSLPADVYEADFANYDFERDIIVDWELRTEQREFTVYSEDDNVILDAASAESGGSGTGGSLARFNIVGDYLYAVQQDQIHTFDISTLDNPVKLGEEYVGWQIETIFAEGDYLYIGSVSGMYIYAIDNPAAPTYLSNVNHILGCDPVVVKGDYAYVTIRGGNLCGQQISQLDVIDISDKSNPFIDHSIAMQEPYGLGVKDNRLYVSDGSNGLVQFNISDPLNTTEEIRYNSLEVLDIIPQEDLLVMVGNNVMYNYEYTDEGIGIIASFSLN
ncbi:MAG: hypothetical protein ABJM06_13800 [Gilvibacter sp.]